MALILCPECSNFVSSSARACPICGYSVSRFRLFLRRQHSRQFRTQPANPTPALEGLQLAQDAVPCVLSALVRTTGRVPTRSVLGTGTTLGSGVPIVGVGGEGRVAYLVPKIVTVGYFSIATIRWYLIGADGLTLGRVPRKTVHRVVGADALHKAQRRAPFFVVALVVVGVVGVLLSVFRG